MPKLRHLAVGSVLILGSLTIPTVIRPEWGAKMLDAAPWFSSRYSWGSDGQDGRSGRDGRSGQGSTDQTVFADGGSLNLDLSGSDGSDGSDGEHGESARCPVYWDKPEHNINGADGGDGGRGGTAGSGGNGGNLTIFYQQPQALKNIFADTTGGQAGLSGRGGYGGDGCECLYSSWRVKTCTWEEVAGSNGQERQEKCTTKTYYCRDGSDGRDGGDGSVARNGSQGNVTLVQGISSIPADNPTTKISVAALQSSPVTLTKNRWRSQSGLLSKLGGGSKVPNEYTEYVEFWRSPITLQWQANQPSQPFDTAEFSLSLNDDKNLVTTQTGSLWLDYNVAKQGEGFQITVVRAMAESDATQLIRQGLEGQGRDLKLKLVDLGQRSDWLNTTFRVQYRTRNPNPEFREGYTYETRYDEILPPAYVEQNQGEFTLHIGDLPMPYKYLESGTGVEIEIAAERTFADNSTVKTIRWQGLLP